MAKRLAPILLVSLLLGAAALLTVHRSSPSRESLLPVLRTVQDHEKQADRAIGRAFPITAEEERAAGEPMARRLREAPAAGDASAAARRLALQARLREFGGLLASRPEVTRFHRRYEFDVLDWRVPNAMALPGGFIFFTEEMMLRTRRDEAALASIIGHELGHVELGHTADMVRSRVWAEKVGAEGLAAPAVLLRALAERHFSETQELEADLYGLRLMAAAGFDPRGALRAMDALGVTDASDSRARRRPDEVAVEGLADWIRTHPGAWERRGKLKQEIERLGR